MRYREWNQAAIECRGNESAGLGLWYIAEYADADGRRYFETYQVSESKDGLNFDARVLVDGIESNWPSDFWTIAPGASPGCRDCGLEDVTGPDAMESADYEAANESFFSWSACDCCGSPLGGDRHHGHAIGRDAFGPDAPNPDNVHHIDMCTDCLLFTANGDLPENHN